MKAFDQQFKQAPCGTESSRLGQPFQTATVHGISASCELRDVPGLTTSHLASWPRAIDVAREAESLPIRQSLCGYLDFNHCCASNPNP